MERSVVAISSVPAAPRVPFVEALFGDTLPRTRALQTATLELEFPCEWRDPDCHLWFFEHRLPGYSWYVPKACGWLNIGIGGMAARLKQRGDNLSGALAALRLEDGAAIRDPHSGRSDRL